VQNKDGSYTKIEEPLTNDVLERHLKGEITVGSYQLAFGNAVKYLCFDFDPEKLADPRGSVSNLLNTLFELKEEEPGKKRPRVWPYAVMLEASRFDDPSFHVWIFFEPRVPAQVAKWLGFRCLELAELNPKQVEVFPKQTELTKDRPYGNFVKLPLGFHQVEKKWSRLLDPKTFEPLPNEALLNCWGISFSEADMAKAMRFEDKTHIQATLVLPENFKPLKNREEEKAAKFLAKYWRPGYRNKLEMAFLGFCLKKGVNYESARRIIEKVCETTGDEEKQARLQLVKYHYGTRRRLGSQLVGVSGLREIVREALK
jgi:hypothetical protein